MCDKTGCFRLEKHIMYGKQTKCAHYNQTVHRLLNMYGQLVVTQYLIMQEQVPLALFELFLSRPSQFKNN